VILIDPLSIGFACATAVIMTGTGVPSLFAGAELGATKSPELEMNPVAWLPPATPPTSQVTFVLELPVTVAVNCKVPNTLTVACGALTVTVTVGNWCVPPPPPHPLSSAVRTQSPAILILVMVLPRFFRATAAEGITLNARAG
jgi:hypothetical protein